MEFGAHPRRRREYRSILRLSAWEEHAVEEVLEGQEAGPYRVVGRTLVHHMLLHIQCYRRVDQGDTLAVAAVSEYPRRVHKGR